MEHGRYHTFRKSIQWIKGHTVDGNGICLTDRRMIVYPEVTGYYIPSLLEWGERDLAVSFASHLCIIQKEDGSWYDSADQAPYTFDTAQILKGLIAIHDLYPSAEDHIRKGCDWMLVQMQPDGRLTTPDKSAWGDDETYCSELIHLYCLTPLVEAGRIYGRQDYIDAAYKALDYYKAHYDAQIKSFSLLSHFYAYVMEGLCDMGETDLVRTAMDKLEQRYLTRHDDIPGLNSVRWVCSTGMFQLALVWYKLGERKRGDRLFDRALSYQNASGGWYGSYHAGNHKKLFTGIKDKPTYFPDQEISWVVKYFLDALAWKTKLGFEDAAPSFLDAIDKTDGRYLLVRDRITAVMSEKEPISALVVCDVGCGKGRYLKNLVEDIPENDYYAVDLSETVMREIDCVKEKRSGRLTNIPYPDDMFDVTYTCEAIEHAIHLEGALRELLRVTRPGGVVVVVDKPEEKLGALQIDPWEQWVNDADMRDFADSHGAALEIIPSISYENGRDDGLFRAWILRKQAVSG